MQKLHRNLLLPIGTKIQSPVSVPASRTISPYHRHQRMYKMIMVPRKKEQNVEDASLSISKTDLIKITKVQTQKIERR